MLFAHAVLLNKTFLWSCKVYIAEFCIFYCSQENFFQFGCNNEISILPTNYRWLEIKEMI